VRGISVRTTNPANKMALLKALSCFSKWLRMATWRSGYAAVCKTVYPGSIPGVASNKIKYLYEGRNGGGKLRQ
jgi:hypothetical protein